jgi:bifunctional DNase/RNase
MGASPFKIWTLAVFLVLGLLWGPAVAPAALTPERAELEAMTVKEVAVDQRTNQPVLLLQSKDGKRLLPVWIGAFEANAIMLELRNFTPPRPMTHDLIKNILKGVDATVVRVVIHDLQQSTYLAQIILQVRGSEVSVDSRPSDAIALALRVKAPIFVSAKVLSRAEQMQEIQALQANVLEKYGLILQDLTPELARHFKGVEPGGVLVAGVREESSASRDGLRRGDLIHRVNGAKVASLDEFLQTLRTARESGKVEFALSREERLHTVAIKDLAVLE